MSPALQQMLRAGKEYEINGEFCLTEGWSFPTPPKVDGEEIDTTLWNYDEITAWHKASNKIVVHDRAPTNDRPDNACWPFEPTSPL